AHFPISSLPLRQRRGAGWSWPRLLLRGGDLIRRVPQRVNAVRAIRRPPFQGVPVDSPTLSDPPGPLQVAARAGLHRGMPPAAKEQREFANPSLALAVADAAVEPPARPDLIAR